MAARRCLPQISMTRCGARWSPLQVRAWTPSAGWPASPSRTFLLDRVDGGAARAAAELARCLAVRNSMGADGGGPMQFRRGDVVADVRDALESPLRLFV